MATIFKALVWIAVTVSSCMSQSFDYVGKNSEGNNLNLAPFRACLSSAGNDPATQLIEALSNPAYYAILNHQWNTRIEKTYPLAYFLPSCTTDVQNVVRCGLTAGIQLVPNSGGHSYEALSFGSNSTLIVDFRLMNNVDLLGDGITAQIQPGALLGHIYAHLWMLGKRSISAGMCLTVAIGGNAIGGGIGYMDSVYGLAADNVVEFEMVTASGEVVTASAETNADLYWALRGVGPGYIGMVTSFKIKTFNAAATKITLAVGLYPIEDFVRVTSKMQDWFEWSQTNEPNVHVVGVIGHENYTSQFAYLLPGINVVFIHIQDEEYNPGGNVTNFLYGIDKIFNHSDPAIANLPEINITHVPSYLAFVLSYIYYTPVNFPLSNGTVVQIGILEDPVLNQDPEYAYPPPGSPSEEYEAVGLKRLLTLRKEMAVERFLKTKSFYVKRNLTLLEMEAVAPIIQKIPLNQAWVLVNTENGRIGKVGRTETAYVHRDSMWNVVINVESIPEYGDTTGPMKWLGELWEAGQSFDGGETYQNYPDLEVVNHFERNYKENFERLKECKTQWDPQNYFNWTYSLPVGGLKDIN